MPEMKQVDYAVDIDNVIDWWQPRLRACVCDSGRYSAFYC